LIGFIFSQFPPARNALALAASLCPSAIGFALGKCRAGLAGGLACESGGDETEKGNPLSAEGIIFLSGWLAPVK